MMDLNGGNGLFPDQVVGDLELLIGGLLRRRMSNTSAVEVGQRVGQKRARFVRSLTEYCRLIGIDLR